MFKPFHKEIRKLLLVLSIITASGLTVSSQTKIEGVINKYAKVTGLGQKYIDISDEAGFQNFSPSDTVLLIQMKGLIIIEDGTISGIPEGKPGGYEYNIITSTDDAINRLYLKNNIFYTFDVNYDLQVVRVPYYLNAEVINKLEAAAWDPAKGTGGVLAAIIGNNLKLGNDMSASGKGFRGGASAPGLGQCVLSSPKLDKYGYPIYTDSAGFKGEGLASYFYDNLTSMVTGLSKIGKGKGTLFTGGGGAVGLASGGGGGGNYGIGGSGGRECNLCGAPSFGGLGGRKIGNILLEYSLFAGGGGGGSVYFPSMANTAGGNGGGIILIETETIDGNSYKIETDGFSAGIGSGTSGAGGGGAGGSISLQSQSFGTTELNISAKGGNGGSHSSTYGEGGGGGGGFIYLPSTPPSNVNYNISAGSRGARPGGTFPSSATNGLFATTINATTRCFLRNAIWSSGSGNLIDSVYFGELHKTIDGSTPSGGSGLYTFRWQILHEGNAIWEEIHGASGKSYSPTDFTTGITYYRRIIYDNFLALSDTSMSVRFKHYIINSTDDKSYRKILSLRPNPAAYEAEINLTCEYTGRLEIKLINSTGMQVSSFMVEKSGDTFVQNLPTGNLAPGYYNVLILKDRNLLAFSTLLIVR